MQFHQFYLKSGGTPLFLVYTVRNDFTKNVVKTVSKCWLYKIGETFYQHLVLGFTVPWKSKFQLLKHGETEYEMLVKCFTNFIWS